MFCPNCRYPQYCPCPACEKFGKTPEGVKTWIWEEDGTRIKCGNCGLTKHCDWWQEKQWEQIHNKSAKVFIEKTEKKTTKQLLGD